MSRARGWVFTVNNPVLPIEFTDPQVKYAVWQLEQGKKGTEHFQGYVEFQNAVGMKRVRTAVGQNPHVEIRRGTRDQAREYAMKEDTRIEGPWEHGERTQQGQRTDLEALARCIKEQGLDAAIEEAPEKYIRYHHGMHKLAEFYARRSSRFSELDDSRADSPLRVYVLHGQAGSGKTRIAYEAFPDLYKLCHDSEQLWWDGYMGEETLLIDDFYGWIKYAFLLNVLDRYPLRLPIKGGFTYAKWNTVIITSNTEPTAWYKLGLTPALSRRITESYEISDYETSAFLAQKLRG